MVGENTKEENALIKFRAAVSDLFENAEDHFLLRWLRARNLDVNKAEEMLRNYVEWRKNNKDLSTILRFIPPKQVLQGIAYKFTGFDYEGRPIIWLPIGRWEVRRFIGEGQKQNLILLQYKILEEISIAVETQRKIYGVNQFVVIADSAELSFWKLASYEVIELCLKFFKEFESYFPELLYSCYFVNNPMVFSYIFNLVKPLISAHTLSKVQMFDFNDTKWKKALLDKLPPESIPYEYGGTGEPVLS